MDRRRGGTPPDPRAIADDLGDLAIADERLGHPDQAIQDLREATDGLSAFRGPSDPATVYAARRTADLMDRAGRPAEARAVRRVYGLDAR